MKKQKIKLEVEFTEGYEKRFTEEIMKIYNKRVRHKEKQEKGQLI